MWFIGYTTAIVNRSRAIHRELEMKIRNKCEIHV